MNGACSKRRRRGCPLQRHKCTVALDRAEARRGPDAQSTAHRPETGVGTSGMVLAGADARATPAMSAAA